jgi:hypothetical protein
MIWKRVNWPDLLVEAFEAGPLTRNDVIRICGDYFFVNPWSLIRQHGFVIEPTGTKSYGELNNPPYYRMISKPSYMLEQVHNK